MTDTRRALSRNWLTVPEVCQNLKVDEHEWLSWQARGDTPLHLVGPDGQLLVRVADLERWIDSLKTNEPSHDDDEAG